jgi:LacI family repressor for deo operon, udp, cdd, tsx, nupC, and nupG
VTATANFPPLGLALVRPTEILGAEPYFHDLIAGIEEVTLPHGYSVLLRVLPSLAEEEAILRHWAERDLVSGIFLVDLQEDDPRPQLAKDLGLPAVVVGPPEPTRQMTVWTDDDAAMKLAVLYLADRGHRTLLHVGGPSLMRHSLARRQSFVDSCEALSLTSVTATGDYSQASGYTAVRAALAQDRGISAAIFDSDLMAIGGLEAADELGVGVPDELALIAWDDSTQAQLSQPALSAVSRDTREVGRQLGQAMLDVIHGSAPEVRHAASPVIIARESA